MLLEFDGQGNRNRQRYKSWLQNIFYYGCNHYICDDGSSQDLLRKAADQQENDLQHLRRLKRIHVSYAKDKFK